MSLNIKNQEAYTLASELARLTGQSMTAVVLTALRRQWNLITCDEQREKRERELMAIAERCAAHIQHPAKAVEHADMLYDDNRTAGEPQSPDIINPL